MESNKGSFGAVLAVAGSACYRGAAALTVGVVFFTDSTTFIFS